MLFIILKKYLVKYILELFFFHLSSNYNLLIMEISAEEFKNYESPFIKSPNSLSAKWSNAHVGVLCDALFKSFTLMLDCNGIFKTNNC